jgi:hypothetical protein
MEMDLKTRLFIATYRPILAGYAQAGEEPRKVADMIIARIPDDFLLVVDDVLKVPSTKETWVYRFAPELRQFDVVHLVTSAFGKLHAGYLDHFSEDQLDLVVRRPVCLGHIDSYDEPVELCGQKSRSWIRTSFFFLSRKSLSKLGSLVSLDDPHLFFSLYGMFKRNSPISDNYKDKITQWLGGDAVQGVAWHGRIDGIDKFRTKALAILNEHMLSIRLRRSGIDLVDLHWLDEELKDAGSSASIAIPSCETQLQKRQYLSTGSGMTAQPAIHELSQTGDCPDGVCLTDDTRLQGAD